MRRVADLCLSSLPVLLKFAPGPIFASTVAVGEASHNGLLRVYRACGLRECIVKDMQSLSFTPGRAFLSSNSPAVPWTAVFEDEGVAGYFYACDRSQEVHEHSILDAMLIYNVAALAKSDAELNRPEPQRIASIEWSRDGLQAVLYLDGTAQALFDFQAHCGYCRMNFPNFLEEQGDTWRKTSHAWSEEALQRFEASLYSSES